MTIINDTRVVRLQRVAARTGHQHSGNERIIETVTDEIVTAAAVVSSPPGSLITLVRGPGSGQTEEGSILNATSDDIGGVSPGQSTSVSFDSEDAGATAASIFVTEKDFSAALSAPGEYAVNYKTFQVKTFTSVPTTPGSRILVSYVWAPIREFLKFNPEDLDPDLIAFGPITGPHNASGGGGAANVIEGTNIDIELTDDGYSEISLDIQSIAGEGLIVVPGEFEPQLQVELDAYQVDYDDSGNKLIFADNLQEAITEIDGYLQSLGVTGKIVHIRKLGSDAENSPFNTHFDLDGNEYPVGSDRLMVFVNGVAQFEPECYVEIDTTSIEFTDNIDYDAVVDILILPGSLGGGGGGTANLQSAYDNSPSGSKTVTVSDGPIRFVQTLSSGAALRLRTDEVTNTTPVIDINHEGEGEAIRAKNIDETKASLLVQKDTSSRNTIVNTTIIERSTSHPIGSQTGIGSGLLTRLEDSGGALFNASRLVTGTEDATDSSEKSFLSIELMDDGIFTEHLRLTSIGRLGLGTSSPDYDIHVEGDGYVSEDFRVGNKVLAGTNTPLAPINIPVFNSDPVTLEDGDLWATDPGAGPVTLKIRSGGTTYTVSLT